jgi:uncharacterized protein YlxP (DUF503 family)
MNLYQNIFLKDHKKIIDMFLLHTGHKFLIIVGGLGPHDSVSKKNIMHADVITDKQTNEC